MLVLVLSIAAAIGLWRHDQAAAEAERRHEFENRTRIIQAAITARLRRLEDLLRATSAQFSGESTISAKRWHRFVAKVGVERRYPGVLGLGYVSLVHGDELAPFIARRRQETPEFSVYPPSERDDYMINTYVEPSSASASIGFDVGSSGERRAAMEQARDTGQTALTQKVTILNNGGMLIYFPVYWSGRPITTVAERRAAIQGWAGVAFSLATLMDGVIDPNEAMDLEVYQGEPSPETLLLDIDGRHGPVSAGPRKIETWFDADIADRTLRVYAASLAQFHQEPRSPTIILFAGCCAGLALWVLMQIVVATLRQKEERLRLVLESSNDGFWDWDITSGTAFFSPQFSAMLGYRPDELQPTRKSWETLVHPDDKQDIKRRFVEHFRGLTPRLDHEYRLRHRKEHWLWVRETAAVVTRDGNRATRMAGMVHDISSRRKAGDRLRLMSAVVEQSPASVIITNSDGVILYVNHMFEAATGYSYDEVFGKKPSILASGLTPRQVYDDLWATITAGREWRGELCNRRKDGGIIWEEAVITQVRTSDGENFYVGVKLDITKKKQAETALLHSQKMEAIGTLAGGISHDFNNILTSILGFNHLILGDIGNPDAVTRHVHQVHLAGTRAKDLVRQILAFSRQMPSQKTAIDLCSVVNEVYQLVRTAAPANIKVTLELPRDKAVVLGTTIQLHQILMNLCLNAIDAIGKKRGAILVVLEHRDGGFDLSVTDTGCGIAPEVLPRIFDPFFTTKEGGSSAGLGLSVVHGIVEDLGGTITVVPATVVGGSQFTLHLPETTVPVEESRVSESPLRDRVHHRGTRILVVDDDPAILDLLLHFFERMGYRVRATATPAEALDWIRQGERFDIVVTDQMMPGTTGIELARTVTTYMPDAKVLLCSGRDDNIDYDEVALARIDGVMLKPFNLIELADTVECLLSEVASDASLGVWS